MASRFDVWVMVECNTTSALEFRAKLPPEYAARSMAAYEAMNRGEDVTTVRNLAIRPSGRTGRDAGPTGVLLGVPERGVLYRHPLADFEELLSIDMEAVRRGEPGPDAEPVDETVFFVCTDGKIDPCCASEGMRLYRDLAARVGDRAYRVSHLGGCRFASNLMTLPDGILYGRVRPEGLDRFLDESGNGRIVPEFYRGRSTLSAAANAAETLLRCELDEWAFDAFSPVGEGSTTSDDSVHESAFRGVDGRVRRVRVRLGEGESARLTCRAEKAMAPPRYELIDITSD